MAVQGIVLVLLPNHNLRICDRLVRESRELLWLWTTDMRDIQAKAKRKLMEKLKTRGIDSSTCGQAGFSSSSACYLAGVVGFVFLVVSTASITVIFDVLRIPFRYE
jgi:hypothetical protein